MSATNDFWHTFVSTLDNTVHFFLSSNSLTHLYFIPDRDILQQFQAQAVY